MTAPAPPAPKRSASHMAGRKTANAVLMVIAWLVTAVALVFLVAILWSLVRQGIPGLKLDVFTMDTPATGSRGGLRNAIIGSLLMCVIGMVIALFFGLLSGTWLSEYAKNSRYGATVRFLNDVLLSAPSILVGMFVYGLLVAPFHGYSGLAGAVALAMLAIPVITRATEDVLSLQPTSLREASVALGTPLWKTISAVMWRASQAGLMTGALLAFARITGETAPLLFTALNNQFLTLDPTKPTGNLPVAIYNFALTPYDDLRQLAWVGALLIAAVVLGVSIFARSLTKDRTKT